MVPELSSSTVMGTAGGIGNWLGLLAWSSTGGLATAGKAKTAAAAAEILL
jgi:hypothetical protein